MKQLQFGEWVIEVDIEATKKYYKHLNIPSIDSQCYRNYTKYCESLASEEKQFFDSLGIDPKRCNVNSMGMDKDGTYTTFGSYCVIGRFLEKPELVLMTLEEFAAQNFICNNSDPFQYIGKYVFDFQHPDCPCSIFP